MLKKFRGDSSILYIPLPLTMTNEGPILQPKKVLAMRTILQGSTRGNQVLIQWEDTPENEATWEYLVDIMASYPFLNLEDKVDFNGRGIVTSENKNVEQENGWENSKMRKGKFVMSQGQVTTNPKINENRRSNRKRFQNKRLEGYV